MTWDDIGIPIGPHPMRFVESLYRCWKVQYLDDVGFQPVLRLLVTMVAGGSKLSQLTGFKSCYLSVATEHQRFCTVVFARNYRDFQSSYTRLPSM